MPTKSLMIAGAVCALTACAATPPPAPGAGTLHDRIITLDPHIDVPLTYGTAEYDPGGITSLQTDLPKMRAGGLDGAFLIVYAPQGPLTEEGYAAALEAAEQRWAGIDRVLRMYSDQVALATTADEVEAIAATGKRVVLLGMENAYPLGPDLDDLPMWVERGIRYVSATHFGHNQFADSSNPNFARGEEEERVGGLTDLGRELIPALNASGVMVDVSHTSDAAALEAARLSQAPVIASHSGVDGVNENRRNMTDELMETIAEKGGAVFMVAFDGYLKAPSEARMNAEAELGQEYGVASRADVMALPPEERAAYFEAVGTIRRTVDPADIGTLIDHLDYAVELIGIDHVGIASDFDGGGGVAGWRDASETAAVTDALVERGYSEEDIAKIWSGNLLRVMREVEQVATELQAEE